MADSILDIKEILSEYSDDIQEEITKEAINIAKNGQSDLKRTSPKKTGEYRKGWKVKTKKGKGFVECTIYNATKPQLTHLLEKPHATRNGGTVKPQVHIKPVEEKCNKEFENNVIRIIKNGG